MDGRQIEQPNRIKKIIIASLPRCTDGVVGADDHGVFQVGRIKDALSDARETSCDVHTDLLQITSQRFCSGSDMRSICR